MNLEVTYNTAYETSQTATYPFADFHVDESGALFITTANRYAAVYAAGVWRQVREV